MPFDGAGVEVANILALADFIEGGRYKFDMGDGSVRTECGSAGCIGGHATVLWPEVREKVGVWFHDGAVDGEAVFSWNTDALCEKLGISGDMHEQLTFPTEWKDGWLMLTLGEIRREQAVETLRRLAATGKVEWVR